MPVLKKRVWYKYRKSPKYNSKTGRLTVDIIPIEDREITARQWCEIEKVEI